MRLFTLIPILAALLVFAACSHSNESEEISTTQQGILARLDEIQKQLRQQEQQSAWERTQEKCAEKARTFPDDEYDYYGFCIEKAIEERHEREEELHRAFEGRFDSYER